LISPVVEIPRLAAGEPPIRRAGEKVESASTAFVAAHVWEGARMQSQIRPLRCRTPSEWRAWLEEHHSEESEAWLAHKKRGETGEGLGYQEALEEALCFGWVDGLLRRLDDKKFLLRYTPRRANSTWSLGNRRKAEELIRRGKMTEAGLEKITRAMQNGQWEAALGREAVNDLPPDLYRELRKCKGALGAFRDLTASRRKQYLWWVKSAKRAETREKSIRVILAAVVGKVCRRLGLPCPVLARQRARTRATLRPHGAQERATRRYALGRAAPMSRGSRAAL